MTEQSDLAAIRSMLEAMQRQMDRVLMTPQPDWIPAREYAERMGVTTRTVRNWILKGEIPSKRQGKTVIVKVNPDA